MLPLNPPAGDLGRVNAIVSGRARRYEVRGFASPLSVKAVIGGSATWSTDAGSFEMSAGGCLILNDGEEYSIVVDSLQPVETFCVFFRRGFVEEALHSATTSSERLIDDGSEARRVEFAERMQFDSGLRSLIDDAYRRRDDESIVAIARRVVELHSDVARRVARLPGLRASTREEIRRRLHRAVEAIHGDVGGDLSLERMASHACLAPFHFHRLFASYFGETPHRYVTRMRLQHAAGLLVGTDRPVTDIALDCGFESPATFTAVFARRFGKPPGRFRKNREAGT